ncbi:colicin E3-like toxin immunity protein [Pseudomonas frederiksbergensis]|uniref:colicin E3-like toxin immunity protein n=1 Tax=Pseudomonas frederiksbergensis TaxID=104087 RepID=UPI003D1C1AE2
MALIIRLEWYDQNTDLGFGEELSSIIEDDDFVFTKLGLTDEYQIFDGGYNVLPEWISLLQSYFKHPIDPAQHDYQIAFRLP